MSNIGGAFYMLKKVLIIVFFLLILIVPSVYSLTASIGGGRAVVRVNASPEEPAVLERTLLIQNKNEIAVKTILKVDEKFEKFVNIIDKEIELQPGESKKARYVLTMDRGGSFEIRINVAFEPLDPTVKENKVGLSATLIVISEGPIIEDPSLDDNETVQEEGINEVNENPYSEADDPAFGNEDIGNSGTVGTDEKNKSNMGWIVGIIIILIIVGAGLGVFFVIQKIKQKN